MPKSRPPYPAAFRQQMVELVRSGRTPGDLAREFEPSAEAIRNWVAQADRDAGKRSDGLRTEEHEEIRRLRRENRRLREEREILTPLYVKNAMGEHYGEVCSRGTEGPRFARIAFTTHGQPRPSTRFAGPPLRSGPSGDCRG